MRIDAKRLAAIKAARAKMTQGEWTSTDNAMGAWIVYFEDDEASVDRIWFGDMESNTGRDITNADGIALIVNSIDDILTDLEEARAALREIVAIRETVMLDEDEAVDRMGAVASVALAATGSSDVT